MNKYILASEPNSSIPIIKHAIGVFVAPQNTPIKITGCDMFYLEKTAAIRCLISFNVLSLFLLNVARF